MDAQKIIAAALPVFAEFLQCGRLCHLSEILLTEQEFNQDTPAAAHFVSTGA